MAKEKVEKLSLEEAENENEKLLAEAKALGVTRSKISLSGFTVRGKTPDPEVMAKEQARHDKLADKRLRARVKQAKLDDKKKPIDKRKELLVSRFKAVRDKVRSVTYTDAQIKAWTEEYNMIVNNPKSWVKLTNNGKVSFIPDNKKKKTAREVLDGMDLE